jgi:signal transduction histidine kinase
MNRNLLKQNMPVRTLDHVSESMSDILDVSVEDLSSTKNSTLFNLILDQLKLFVDYSGALITILEENEIIVLAYRGPLAAAEVIDYRLGRGDESPFAGVIQQKKPVVLPGIGQDSLETSSMQVWLQEPKRRRIFDPFQIILGIPVLAKEQVIGLLILGHNQPDYFSPEKVDTASNFAHTIAEAIEYNHFYRLAHNLATLNERDRLAQELHDNVAQSLGYINLQLSAVNQMLANGKIDEAQASLQNIKQVVGETYTDVREEIFNMRSAEMMGLGFLHTLREYIRKYNRFYQLDIKLDIEVDEALLDFSPNVETQLIRIIQEALINVRKHAGVNEALICLQVKNNQFSFVIEDRGRGIDNSPPLNPDEQSGFGLQIMAERTESIGGLLQIDTPSEGGTRIIIWLPLSLSNTAGNDEVA